MGLWSCNIQVKNEYDIIVLNKIVEDIDFSLIPKSNDSKEYLISRIASSKYLYDIVIYNAAFSVLNENLHSHQPKRRSEGVIMGSIFQYKGGNGEGGGNQLLNYQIIHLLVGTKTIGMEDQ